MYNSPVLNVELTIVAKLKNKYILAYINIPKKQKKIH